MPNADLHFRFARIPRQRQRKKCPTVFGPYPDGIWRTLRQVENDKFVRVKPNVRKDPNLRDIRLIRYADDFVVLAHSRRQLERVVLPRIRRFLEVRGLRLSDEKTRIVRDTDGFEFVGREFKRLSKTKFLVRPRQKSTRNHLDGLTSIFRNHALPTGVMIQKANAVIRGFCDHFRSDHSSKAFRKLSGWTLRTFCKWAGRRNGKMTAGKAYHRLTNVKGVKYSSPTAYTPKGKLVSLFLHSSFHRRRHQMVKGSNSPLDPRLKKYWEDRRKLMNVRQQTRNKTKVSLRTYLLFRQGNRCAISGVQFLEEMSQVEVHYIIPKCMGGSGKRYNLCLVYRWAHQALHARKPFDQVSQQDVPCCGI